MKYICTVDINGPIDKVSSLWENEEFYKNWQDGFQSITLLEGTAGAVGSKSKILLQQGKRKMELIETIVSNDLPNEKKGIYEHIHMTNTQTTKFKKLTENKTRYSSEVEYTKFNGFMPRMMAMLFPGMFKKQSQKWMDQFKEFAEKTIEK